MVQQVTVFCAVSKNSYQLRCCFFWIFKGFNQVFFSSIAPRNTTGWHKHYAKMMGEKERLTWNLMQFVCRMHIFCVIVGYPFLRFSRVLWWFHSDSPSSPRHCRAGLAQTPWACGKRPKKLSKFCGACRKVWHLDFHEIHWMNYFGGTFPPFFLGVQTSLIWLKCLCEMMLEDDRFFFGGMSGNSYKLMKQHP